MLPGGNVTDVCLLIALSRVVPGVPLLVAANRDERYERPAEPITVLRDHGPRILGGRDHVAGGTWLAVNEHGVVAGLTNQPSGPRDPSRRSRGALPLAFAAYPGAATAVAAVVPRLRPADYNPCWLLVGDRDTLFSVDLTGGDEPATEELGPGCYVLENVPLHRRSAKQRRVTALLGEPGGAPAGPTMARLAQVLRDHEPAGGPQTARPGEPPLPAALSAACVHLDGYGTRSAMIVGVAAPASARPSVQVTPGPPCCTALRDESGRWAGVAAGQRGDGGPRPGALTADLGIRDDC